MRKWTLVLALGVVWTATSAPVLDNGVVRIETMRRGAAISALSYGGLSFPQSAVRSFSDRLCRNSGPKTCEFENVGRTEWTFAGKDGQSLRYRLDPRSFNDFRITKTYALTDRKNVLCVTWGVENVDVDERAFGLSTVVGALAGDGVTCFALPKGDGVARWEYPGSTAPMEVSLDPRQRWLAFWDKASGKGALLSWPKGRVGGFTSWLTQGVKRCATVEYFGVSERVKPGETLTLSAEMEFLDNVPSVLATLDRPVGEQVAEPLLFIRKYVDPAFAKCAIAVKRPHLRGLPSEADAAKVLETEFRIPLDFLGAVHTNTVTWHEKWIKPSSSCDVLYMLDPGGQFIGNGMRFLVELLQRTDLHVRTLPLLRQVMGIGRSGDKPYSVYDTTFAPIRDDWTMARLRAVTELPKAAIVQNVDFGEAQKEFRDILAGWQAKGVGFLFVDCRNVPKEFLGRRVREREDELFLLPRMNDGTRRFLVLGRKGENGPWTGELRTGDTAGNPACPPEFLRERHPVFSGRDFPYFDYWYLPVVRALRFIAGADVPARFVAADARRIVAEAAVPGAYELSFEVKGLHRETERTMTRAVTLASGRNEISPGGLGEGLAGGTHVVNVRLRDGAGLVADAAAFRIDVAEPLPLDLVFSHTNRIYSADERVDLSVLSEREPPEGTAFAVELEDVHGRIVRRASRRGAAKVGFSFDLPDNPTRLYRVRATAEAAGRPLAQAWGEFSVRARPPDLEDTGAYITISGGGTAPFAFLRDLGFDYVISAFGDNRRSYLAECANLDIQSVPRNCAGNEAWFRPYRFDAKGDGSGVRKPCFSSPEFKREIAERIESAAAKTGYDYYNVRCHWLGDECFLGSDVCESPTCLRAFRERLAEKYGTIGRLNAAWETGFASFDEVRPVPLEKLKGRDNLAPWLEHRMFMSSQFAREWVGSTLEVLQRVAPGSVCGPTGTQVPGLGYDWSQLMKYVGAAGYYSGAQRKCVHDFAHWYGHEVLAGQCGGGYTHAHYDYEPYNYDTMWSGLLKGSNLAYHYFGAAITGDLAATSNFVYWTTSMRELKGGIGKLFLSAKETCEVAVLYSQASLYAAMANGQDRFWQDAQTSWWRLLSDLKYAFRFYPYELLVAHGVPEGVRAFVLPRALALSDAEVGRLAVFRRRGGVVLADVPPATYDETGRKRTAVPEVADVCVGGRLAEYNAVAGGGIGGETSTERAADAALADELRRKVGVALERAGLKPFCRVTDAQGRPYACDAALRTDGENRVFALHLDTRGASNNGTREGEANTALGRFDFDHGDPVTAKLDGPGHVYDVRARRYLGHTDTIRTSIIPGWTRIYSILREKPGELAVTGPKSVRAGEKAVFRVVCAGAKGPQVFHLELVAPDGTSPRQFRRNVRTTTGAVDYSFETAYNERPGDWRLEVRHVNTGLVSERTFSVGK